MANKIQKILCSDAAQSIRNEISRFESVHPNIYAIYELLEQLDEVDVSDVIKDTIKDYVVAIEDSFVNSQEWTVPRFVNVLKLGIVGSVSSGKSALVHRYLTGCYIQDESPEGGRFKKEVVLEGVSCLLLIRDEGGCPDKQFTLWADAVILVFSLENEESLTTANDYYQRMSAYRNTADIPVILVGTQDAISDTNPRLIDDTKARRMASNFGRATYYETCATYGLNVDRVFLDVCSRMLMGSKPILQISNNIRSRPTTPQIHNHNVVQPVMYPQGAMTQPKRSMSNDTNNNFSRVGSYLTSQSQNHPHFVSKEEEPIPPPLPARPDNLASAIRPADTRTRTTQQTTSKPVETSQNQIEYEAYLKSLPSPRNGTQYNQRLEQIPNHVYSEYNMLMSSSSLATPPILVPASSVFDFSVHHRSEKSTASSADGAVKDPPTPGSTPTQNRKVRRKSHLFKPHSDKDLSTIDKGKQQQINIIGSGRSIPVKQGYLYKRSGNQINKDRKNRKYVTLTEDAKLTYYGTMNDYMNQVRGKEIDLQLTSIKIPGVPFRNSCLPSSTPNAQVQPPPFQNSPACVRSKDNVSQDSTGPTLVSDSMTTDVRNKDVLARNKRHRRLKSNPKTSNEDDQELYEFILIGNDNRQWLFEATTLEERDDWIIKIESLILQRLQLSPGVKKSIDSFPSGFGGFPTSAIGQWPDGERNDSCNNNGGPISIGAIANIIRSIAGNGQCSDCNSPDACWASLNLGTSICIECSGVHRQLGTHFSRVRSFQLDEWSKEQLAVMKSIGNTLANSVWEASVHASNLKKPEPNSSRLEKEAWIRAKYEHKQFLPPLPYLDAPIQQQLIDAITRQDTRQVILCLALAGDAVNSCYSNQDPRTAIHIAATLGNIVYLQLLLWYNANPSVTDSEGRNAFFYAYYSGQHECADFLLRNSCSPGNRQSVAQMSSEEHHVRSQSSSLTMNPQQQQSAFHNQSVGGTLPRHRNTDQGKPSHKPNPPANGPAINNHQAAANNNGHHSNNNNNNGNLMFNDNSNFGMLPGGPINNNYIDYIGPASQGQVANMDLSRARAD